MAGGTSLPHKEATYVNLPNNMDAIADSFGKISLDSAAHPVTNKTQKAENRGVVTVRKEERVKQEDDKEKLKTEHDYVNLPVQGRAPVHAQLNEAFIRETHVSHFKHFYSTKPVLDFPD